MKKHSTIDNGLFGKVESSKMEALEKNAIKDSRIRLCGSLLTPSQEVVPIAEALVAYDPKSDTIIKMIAAFIPPTPWGTHQGAKYLISKHANGEHKPVVIHHNPEAPKKEGAYWNPHFLTGFLDYSKLPMTNENAEFRVLRAYRAGIRAPARFELLAFAQPEPGQDVDKRTMEVEIPFNSVPPIQLAFCHKSLFWWQKQIIQELGDFSGVDLAVALGLGIKRKLDNAVQAGVISETVAEDILHDHSEDPVELSESLAASFGVTNMVKAEDEGKDFYVPTNPLLQTMPDKEEEVSESIAASFEMGSSTEEEDVDYDVPVNPLLKTDKEEEEELVELHD